MATSTNFVAALGGGSGIDIKALAQNLVNAEKSPKEELIKASIAKTEARISGYSTVQYALSQVQSALDALKNPAVFNAASSSSSLPSSVAATITGAAMPATYQLKVTQLAQAQRSVSTDLQAGAPLNAGQGFTFKLNIAGNSSDVISVAQDTPEAFVQAINNAGLDVKASLVNTSSTGSTQKIILTGKSGAQNDFFITDVSSPSVNLGLPTTLAEAESPTSPSLAASDATFLLDGVEVQRSTNQVSDVIDGVTLNLLSLTGNQSAVVTIARDTAPIKEKIKAVVDNYNDLQSILDAAFDKESKVENLGGTLVGDSSVRALRDQMRRIMLPDGATMGSSSAPLSNLRQLGLMIDTDGKMKFASLKASASPGESLINMGDEAVLDRALAQRFDEVADLFAGAGGLAKDMSDRISGSGVYVDSTFSPSSPKKILNALSLNAGQRITADKQRLVDLERRMEQLLDRYTRQFSVMESLVGESKATRTGVENSFKGMSYSRS